MQDAPVPANERMDQDSTSSTTQWKNHRGKPVRSGQKLMAHNVYCRYVAKGHSKSDSIKRTAADVGLSERLLWNVIKTMEESGEVKSPKKKRLRRNMFDILDEEQKKTIRQIVHHFFLDNELPTLNKVYKAIEENESLPPMGRTTVHKVLKKLGFVHEKRGRDHILVERTDIILWRRRYLSNIKKYRQQERVIYYLDETWVNAGHTKQKIWKDKTIKSARQAFIEGLSVGLKEPKGKGQRFIITHIGNENGFVPAGLLMFTSNTTGDYHEEMNGTVFTNWIKKILPHLAPKAVIVLDNAPYHSVKAEKTPTTAWRKADIASYLTNKGIEVHDGMLKVELLDLAKTYLAQHPVSYVVDTLVKSTGREVLRLPPYHCHLNPIELVWAQVKGFVAANNKTFKLSDVKRLFEEGLQQVTPARWAKCVEHVKKQEEDLYRLDIIQEEMTLQFTVNTGSSSDESSASDFENDFQLLE